MKHVSSLSRVSARFLAWAFCISCCIVSAETVDFVHEVVPILRAHCVKCHGGEEAKGGFSLNTRKLFLEGGAAEPGASMPPKEMRRRPESFPGVSCFHRFDELTQRQWGYLDTS